MNRKIQFRGFNLKNKQWIYGYYLVNRGKHYIVQDEVVEPFKEASDFEVDAESVGQWLTNVDGVDLYEGDIVETIVHTKSYSCKSWPGIIKWYDLYSRFVYMRNSKCIEDFIVKPELSFIVIGNEYEKKKRSTP